MLNSHNPEFCTRVGRYTVTVRDLKQYGRKFHDTRHFIEVIYLFHKKYNSWFNYVAYITSL